jgi:hypothetical protein
MIPPCFARIIFGVSYREREVCMIRAKAASILDALVNGRLLVYMMLGFAISYFFFFIRPTFLNELYSMQIILSIPRIDPIGYDLKQTLDMSHAWFIGGGSPYVGDSFNHPLTAVLYTPLLFIDFSTADSIITFITLGCFLCSTLLIPLWIGKHLAPLLVLLLVVGTYSYPFQFELERGQFNVIAFCLSLLAIYLYYYHPKYRSIAYLLFSIAVQLKIWPAIFILMFIRDWRDWRGSLKRITAIAGVNLAALFILGPKVFVDFVNATLAHIREPYVYIGNHSIKAFVTVLTTQGISRIPASLAPRVIENKSLIETIFLAFVGICLLLIVMRAYQQNTGRLNPSLLLACTLVARLVPSVSYDYALSILPAAVAIAFDKGTFMPVSRSRRVVSVLLVILVGFTFSSTLYSYANKPFYFGNNLPALMLLLFALTILCLIQKSFSFADPPSGKSEQQATLNRTA